MTEYLTEQEQVELLKSWIKQYSLVILAGVIIAILAISGSRYWQERQNKILLHASSIYDEMLTKRAQNDTNATVVAAQKLLSHYPQTVYAQMGAFMLAQNAISMEKYQEAETHFNWLLNHSKIPPIRQIARIRLARVMIAEQKPKEAIQILKSVEDKNFNGLTLEVQGDAYLAWHNIPMARESYQRALSELPNAQAIRPLLQMKYDDLATINQTS